MVCRGTLWFKPLREQQLGEAEHPEGRALSLSSRILQESPAAAAAPDWEEYDKKEKCGLFGVWGPKDASQVCYQGLFALQHRGQESAGIAVTTGTTLNGHAGMGLVSQVFNPRMLREELAGNAGIGHVR